MMELRIKQLDDRAKLPRRAHPSDAGLDLAPIVGKGQRVICPGETVKYRTGLAAEIPPGCFGMVVPRSSAKLKGLDVLGVLDSDYRGEIHIVVTNTGNDTEVVEGGQYIAQLIIIPCLSPAISIVPELSETGRGVKGFGSSG